jgi:hypothetical protein
MDLGNISRKVSLFWNPCSQFGIWIGKNHVSRRSLEKSSTYSHRKNAASMTLVLAAFMTIIWTRLSQLTLLYTCLPHPRNKQQSMAPCFFAHFIRNMYLSWISSLMWLKFKINKKDYFEGQVSLHVHRTASCYCTVPMFARCVLYVFCCFNHLGGTIRSTCTRNLRYCFLATHI